MLRENTSIAFVVDPSLRVLLWSNGLVEATNLTQGTVEGRDVSCLPFLSADNRDNTTALGLDTVMMYISMSPLAVDVVW